jgi:predicted amidohydrolase
MSNLKIAICQLRSSDDPYLNLLLVNDFVHEATAAGAEIIFFPENVFYRGPKNQANLKRSDLHLELDANGYLLSQRVFDTLLAEFSSEWKIFVSLGSVFEYSAAFPKPFNSHWCFDPHSKKFISYRKIHLFDFESSSGITYRESDEVSSGDTAQVLAMRSTNIGLSICYDLRFPELYRYLTLVRKCQVLAVPAAFTRETGKDHWHTLLRARAIENQAFVIAAAQWGSHRNSNGQELYCFGNSVVYAPWGDVLYCADQDEDSLGLLKIDLNLIEQMRSKLPALQSAKFFHSKVST